MILQIFFVIRSPILQGSTEQKQLTLISQLCGSITPEVWPTLTELELYGKIELPKNLKRRVFIAASYF